MRKVLAVAFLAPMCAALIFAQSSSVPSFEVVSIKISPPDASAYFRPAPDGFTAGKTTVKLLIETAYTLQDYQISGGPAWIESDEFDLAAKAGHPIASPELKLMLQNLLAGRFNLAMHVDPKKLPGYALVLAKGGAKLREPTGTRAQVSRTGTRMEAHHLGFSSLVDALQVIVGRPVVDRTGLQGAFDFTLDWARDNTATAPADAAPSIFTAVQEQLGLKLEPLAAAGDLYLIDHVERPEPN
jgi:uncharacterized protein (TIGR03435 family)